MRVSLLTDGIYPYVIGGMQKHSFYLAKYLSRKGCEIDLYHFRINNLEKTKKDVFGEDADKINLIEVPFPETNKLPLHYLRESKKYSENIFNSFLQQPSSDFIIAKGFTGSYFLKKKKERVKLPPVAVNFHGYEMFQSAFTVKDKLIQALLRPSVGAISRRADYVFSYGGKITEILREKLNIPSEKILEFPSGIEKTWLNHATNNANKIRFVFIGRFEPRKGINELNKVLRELKGDNWTFDFIGAIPEDHRLKQNNIVYHGLITDQVKVKNILSSCDILVCPSWSEGMPNVIIEGMASGLSVIATDTGATRLLVNNKTGWLIDDPSFENLFKAFQDVFASSQQQLIEKKKEAVRLIESDFLWDEIADRLYLRLKEITGAD